jgi:hypothetical protein
MVNERNIIYGTTQIIPHKISWTSSLSSKGYVEEGASVTLNSDYPLIMYSIKEVPRTYNAALYKVKILYR